MKNVSSILVVVLTVFTLLLVGCTKDEVETTGSIYGIVNDSVTGEPIKAGMVTLNPGGKSTTTGSDGRYEFNEMTPGQYTIQIAKTGYVTNTKRVTVVAGEMESGDLLLTPVQE